MENVVNLYCLVKRQRCIGTQKTNLNILWVYFLLELRRKWRYRHLRSEISYPQVSLCEFHRTIPKYVYERISLFLLSRTLILKIVQTIVKILTDVKNIAKKPQTEWPCKSWAFCCNFRRFMVFYSIDVKLWIGVIYPLANSY